MRGLAILVLAIGLLSTIACSPASAPTGSGGAPPVSVDRQAVRDAGSARPPLAIAPQEAAGRASTAGASAPADAMVPRLDRMVVATVQLQLAVENAIAAARGAERIAVRYGGFVGSSSIRDLETSREATMTLRIPGASLTDALADLRAIGKRVSDETMSTEDVTEEYTDVESNIRNLRLTEAQILALMERASKMEEILVLQRELTNIRGQIERLEGRRRVLESRSSYANVSLRITEPVTASPRAAWSLPETAAQALAALARLGQGLATIAIWVLVFLPVYGIPAALFWWLARHWTTRRPATGSTMQESA